MKNSLRWLASCIASVSALLLGGCIELGVSYSDKDETIQVNYYKGQCKSDSSSLCFMVKQDSGDSFAVFENFSGFSAYQWGNQYSVEVETSFDDSGDPESYRYLSTKSTDAVDNAFSMKLYSAAGVLTTSDQLSWNLGGEISFTTTAEQGAVINAAVTADEVMQLQFTAANNVLTFSKVLCSAAEKDFAAQCEGTSSVDWTIAHFQSDCNLNTEHLCLIYRVDESDDWELLQTDSSDIEGFTPEWGKEYNIEVIKTVSDGGQLTSAKLDDDGGDDSPTDRLDTTYRFVFVLNGRLLAKPDSNNQTTLYDSSQVLNCGSVCSAVEDAIDSDNMMLLRGYVQSSEVFVDQVLCDENPGSAFNSCVDDYNDDQDSDNKVTWWPPLN